VVSSQFHAPVALSSGRDSYFLELLSDLLNERGRDARDKGKVRNTYIFVGGTQGRNHVGDMGEVGKIILKWIFEKQGVNIRTGFNYFRTGFSCRILRTR
jgi:hypothetical protein